jgi:hypothetical protein
MKRSLPLCGILLAVGALSFAFAASGNTSTDPGAPAPTTTKATSAQDALAPRTVGPNCKPDAPVRVDLHPRSLIAGNARIDYDVTPVMPALDLEVEVLFPQGGSVRWHNAPARGPAERQVPRSGSVSVDLPTNLAGVEVEVRAYISIPDPDAPDGVGVYATSRTVAWGAEVERIVDGVTEVTTDGVITLDTAATRN